MKMKDLKTSNITIEELQEKVRSKGWAASAIGSVVYFVLELFGYAPRYYCGVPYFEIGKNWGGLEMGWFFLICKNAGTHTKNHEIGHLIQNAEIGGLSMVWWSLCSCARYWARRIFKINTPYDSWWFEGNATSLGYEFAEKQKITNITNVGQ